MDITLTCNLSLSKKLRALIGNSETSIRILSDVLRDGKAQADITLSVDQVSKAELAELIDKETSIMLTPIGISESVVARDEGVTNIFAEGIDPDAGPRTAVNRLAVTKPPEKKTLAYAIKTKEEVQKETPAPFKVTQNPEFKKFINDFETLIEAVHAAEHKAYSVNPDEIQDPRKRALALEAKEKAEAIDYPAYVVNDSCANITLNDLGINLKLNAPFNLNNISAKRIAASKELPAMLRAGYIKFITPDEIQDYVQKVVQEDSIGSLEVFGGKSGSAKAFSRSDEVNAGHEDVGNEIDLEDNTPTEQDKLLKIYQAAPKPQAAAGSRVSQHGSTTATPRPAPKNPNIKSVKRSGIEFS